MTITLSALQKQRRDSAANWTFNDPTLLAGELGYETDTGKWKVGDGSTAWTSLAYIPGSQLSAYPLVDADIAAAAEIAVSKLANGTANQILTTDGTNVSWTDDPTIAGNVTIEGNLTVNGTETIINVDILQVEDKSIEIGKVATPTDVTADGGGIVLKGSTDKTITWIDSTDAWTFSEHVNIASGKEYRIAGTKVLDATSLGSAVVSSSLTSVGTIGSGTWQGSVIDAAYLDSTLVQTTDTGTVTSAMIADGTIVDGDINASAAIAQSKLSLSITDAEVNASAAIAGSKIQAASTSNSGAVQLTDSTSSTSTTTAATPNAVKSAYDLAAAALPKAGGTLTGDVTLNAQSDLRFADSDSSNWVALQAPATVAANVTWTLPDADGSADQVLKTDGSGGLGWASPSVSGPILENQQTISADYTLTTAYNGVSAGPVEVAAGFSVTVPASAVWAII